MCIKEQITNSKDRNSRLAGIRASLKDIPLLRIASSRLELKSKTSIATSDSELYEQSDYPNSKTKSIENSIDIFTQNSFFEKYELLQKLGEGSNGCVYKCQHKVSKDFYAVKKFKVEEQHILELKKSFINIQKLKHKSFCNYIALYFDDRQRFAFLVMEYFPYPNLSEFSIKSEEDLKSIVKQLISGLQYLHKQNICHRDIKPQNILYNHKDGVVKIVDFGISKKTFSRGVRRDMLTIIGTNFYFAPEIYIGGGYDERVDIWALGVTIYKLIAGYTPFESEYHSDTIVNIMKGEVAFDEKKWSNFSGFAKDFVARLLKKRSKRMSLRQCQKHLWIQSSKGQNSQKFKKRYSFSLQITQDFKREMETAEQSLSKQEGSFQKCQVFGKKINLINVDQYDLVESIDPELFEICSPNRTRHLSF